MNLPEGPVSPPLGPVRLVAVQFFALIMRNMLEDMLAFHTEHKGGMFLGSISYVSCGAFHMFHTEHFIRSTKVGCSWHWQPNHNGNGRTFKCGKHAALLREQMIRYLTLTLTLTLTLILALSTQLDSVRCFPVQ